MKCMFLEKFFPASRIVTIEKKIHGIRQHSREILHEYWERFNNSNNQVGSTSFTQDYIPNQLEILLMTIAKHSSIAILRLYTNATSSVGRD
ncbi:hypothetical protein CR513_26683, partial [Mucuna pruriens]